MPRSPVHPRVCGELSNSAASASASAGSSPRVRGTPPMAAFRPPITRFIPACAGNSKGDGAGASCASVHPRVCGELGFHSVTENPIDTVHPRVCGELVHVVVGLQRVAGSSPRVRGTLVLAGGFLPLGRFIPACAGNSTKHVSCPATPAVHPRVCGELGRMGRAVVEAGGSSPRVRGTRSASCRCGGLTRFIPACAGNSRSASRGERTWQVHPRVCGELTRPRRAVRGGRGSSPRVRGTLVGPSARRRSARFIPACAGNSSARSTHPFPATGSSPRVRGTRGAAHEVDGFHRFIPACAGNSSRPSRPKAASHGSSPRVRGTRRSRPCRWTRRAVHPRVCGELLADGRRPMAGRRFIPACAGNSIMRATRRLAFIGSSPRVRGTRRPPTSI